MKTLPSVQIGIVNTSPLPEDAAFYNEYALLNRESGYAFTGKFILRVLDLSYLDCVPKEEHNTPLYYWASVFKARSWKELLKLAKQSESIKKAVVTLRKLSEDEKIRLQCEARERYWMDWQSSMRTNWEEGKAEGISIGIAQEKSNTEKERLRAEAAEMQLAKYKEKFGQI